MQVIAAAGASTATGAADGGQTCQRVGRADGGECHVAGVGHQEAVARLLAGGGHDARQGGLGDVIDGDWVAVTLTVSVSVIGGPEGGVPEAAAVLLIEPEVESLLG